MNLIRVVLFLLFTAMVCASNALFAQTVALGRISHVDYERNDPDTTNINLDLLLARLGADTSYKFVERATVDRLVAEQALTREGFARADGAARLGRLLQTDLLLCGTFFTPAGQPASLILDVIEPARAEIVASSRLEIGPVLQRGHLAPLAPSDIEAISRASVPLLASGWREIQNRPNQVLLKLLALPNLTGNPAFDGLGAHIEQALGSLALTTPGQRLLRTLRPDVAIQESELRLLGLVESEPAAWSQLADHYLWGACETSPSGPVITLDFWAGGTSPQTRVFPLPANADELDAFLNRIAAEILTATQAPTRRERPADAPQERARLAAILLAKAKVIGDPLLSLSLPFPPSCALAFEEASRLAASAVFLDPAQLENWIYLAMIRDSGANLYYDSRKVMAVHRAAVLEFKFAIVTRFIIRADGKINQDIFNRIPWFGPASLEDTLSEIAYSGESFSDIYQGRNLLLLKERIRADIATQLDRITEVLTKAPYGREDDFRQAAETLLSHALVESFPPEHSVRLISRLWPRLKIAHAVSQAWSSSYSMSDFEVKICEPYLRLGQVDEAKNVGLLNPAELAAALKLSVSRVSHYSPSPYNRLCAETYLRSQSTQAPDPRSVVSSLIQVRSLSGPGGYAPLNAYPLDARAQYAADFLSSYQTAATQGYPSGVLARLRATVQKWASATEVVATPKELLNTTRPPVYLNLVEASSFLMNAAVRGDVFSLYSLFELGAPVEASGLAFIAAIQMHQWPTVEYLLERGYNPASPWPVPYDLVFCRKSYWPGTERLKDIDNLGSVALAEAAWAGRLDLVDRLVASGVALQPGSEFTDTVLKRLVRMNQPEILEKVLKSRPIHPSSIIYLNDVIARKDLPMLRMLLAANAEPQEFIERAGPARAFWEPGIQLSESRHTAFDRLFRQRALSYAASQNWREGVEAMLTAPALDSSAFDQLPHTFATDLATRALLLQATLEASLPDPSHMASGVALMVAISRDDAAAVTAIWKDPAARHIRFRGQSPLDFAVTENRPALARLLVGLGARLDDPDEYGVTPLAHAAGLGDVELVRFLAAKGADLNLQRGEGNTPLGYAIYSYKEAAALALLDLGAAVESPSAYAGSPPLFQATRANMTRVVERLLALGANPRAISDGFSIFFPAAISNNPALIQRFVDLGCDLNHRNNEGWTPLVSAVRWGADESTAKLLTLGMRDPLAADTAVSIAKEERPKNLPSPTELHLLHFRPNYRRCIELMEEANQIADSPAAQNRLFWERLFDKTEAQVTEFLKNGGDVNFEGTETPLQRATSLINGDEPWGLGWVKFLLAHGAKTELTGTDAPDTPLRRAIGPGRIETIRVLLEHGARVDARPVSHFEFIDSILANAISHPDVEPAIVRLLLDHGAVIDEDSVAGFERLRKTAPARIPLLEAVLTPVELGRLRGGL